ncbi:MAG: hypothetical protein IKF39_02395 [Oscillospiraceae bacterium]|nr:hypothetical protein [Oscillospiraceae bacterium]
MVKIREHLAEINRVEAEIQRSQSGSKHRTDMQRYRKRLMDEYEEAMDYIKEAQKRKHASMDGGHKDV